MYARKLSNMECGEPMFFICTVLECGRIIPLFPFDLTPLCVCLTPFCAYHCHCKVCCLLIRILYVLVCAEL